MHRIDKVTSGLVLLAKSLDHHGPLTRQFAKQSAQKHYIAVLHSVGEAVPSETFSIDLPLRTASNGRVRIAAERSSIEFDSCDLHIFYREARHGQEKLRIKDHRDRARHRRRDHACLGLAPDGKEAETESSPRVGGAPHRRRSALSKHKRLISLHASALLSPGHFAPLAPVRNHAARSPVH